MIGKTTKGRWTSSQDQIQSIPKNLIYGPDHPQYVSYEEIELKVIAAMYPGQDGIGADVKEIKSESRRKRSKVPPRKR